MNLEDKNLNFKKGFDIDLARQSMANSGVRLRREKRDRLTARRRGFGHLTANLSDGSFPLSLIDAESQTPEIADASLTDAERFTRVLDLAKKSRDETLLVALLTGITVAIENPDSPYSKQAVDLVPRLVSILRTSQDPLLLSPALLCLGNLEAGAQSTAEQIIKFGVVELLFNPLQSEDMNVFSRALFTLNNLIVDNE